MKNKGIRIWELMVLVTLVAAVLYPPNSLATRQSSAVNQIINNLRQLDEAKEQWILENRHRDGEAVELTPEILAPYLRGGWTQPIASEQYILSTQRPEAVLTREVEGYPVGTVISLDEPFDFLPLQTHLANEKAIARRQLVLFSLVGVLVIGVGAFLLTRTRAR